MSDHLRCAALDHMDIAHAFAQTFGEHVIELDRDHRMSRIPRAYFAGKNTRAWTQFNDDLSWLEWPDGIDHRFGQRAAAGGESSGGADVGRTLAKEMQGLKYNGHVRDIDHSTFRVSSEAQLILR